MCLDVEEVVVEAELALERVIVVLGDEVLEGERVVVAGLVRGTGCCGSRSCRGGQGCEDESRPRAWAGWR